MSYRGRIRHVKDGEAVAAGILGRPSRDLEGNLRDVTERVRLAELGQAVIAYDQGIDPSAQVGEVVYWNDLTNQFELALAATRFNTETQRTEVAPSARPQGIVAEKSSATLGDILLFGLHSVDLSTAVGASPVPPGTYFLSATTPGKLVQQSPAISIPILTAMDGGIVVLRPSWREFLEDHVHYRFALVARPAGTPSVPDPDQPGWLPADHSVFGGRAPQDAVYGYNIAQDPNGLASVFPPIPPESACLFQDGMLKPPSLCQVDRFGIWWMSSCTEEKPWPDDYIMSPPPGPCPSVLPGGLVLSFSSMVTATDRSVVTSLSVVPGSPLSIVDCDGHPAHAGGLLIGLDLDFLSNTDPLDGDRVLKTVEGLSFRSGFVVEGLRAGTNAHLTSTRPKSLGGGNTLHQGTVTVDFLPNQGDIELVAEVIRLGRAQERFYLEFPSFGFPAGRATDLWLRFAIPPAGLPTSPLFRLRLVIAGDSAGTIPALQATRRSLPRPSGGPVALPAPGSATALTVAAPGGLLANQAVEVESATFPVAAGATVLIQLARAASDGYAGEILALRLGGVISGGDT